MIYSISCRRLPPSRLSLALESVGPGSWPRIQAWTMQFARESIPPIQANALLAVTREMMADGNLFLLRKDGVACGMGGFGRSTPNSLVITKSSSLRKCDAKAMRRLISGLVAKAGERFEIASYSAISRGRATCMIPLVLSRWGDLWKKVFARAHSLPFRLSPFYCHPSA